MKLPYLILRIHLFNFINALIFIYLILLFIFLHPAFDQHSKTIITILGYYLTIVFSNIRKQGSVNHYELLFYQRKSTYNFFIELILINSFFLFISLSIYILSISPFIWPLLSKIPDFISISDILLLYIVLILIFIYTDIFSMDKSLLTTQNDLLQFNLIKTLLLIFKWFLFSFSALLIFFLSRFLGYLYFIIYFGFLFMIFNPVIKKILSIEIRKKYLKRWILLTLILILSIGIMEWKLDDKKYFIYSKYLFHKESKNKKSNNFEKIKSFDDWYHWYKDYDGKWTGESIAKSLDKLTEVCPPQKRISPFFISCKDCSYHYVKFSSYKLMKNISEEEKQKIIQRLFQSKSEYTQLFGLLYGSDTKNRPNNIKDKIQKISENPNHNLQYLAKKILNKQVKQTSNWFVIFNTTPGIDCKENQNEEHEYFKDN